MMVPIPRSPSSNWGFRVSVSPIRMVSWGARVLYLGPSFELSAHRNVVGVLCVCLDQQMEVFTGAGLLRGEGILCRSAYIEPGTRHRIDFAPGRIACLYVDRESDDPARIQSQMRQAGAGVWTDHAGLDGMVEALKDLAEGRLPREQRRATLAQAYGLADAGEGCGDERVSRAIRMILDDPAQPHRASVLARKVGLSESRFRHAFREAAGVTLKRFRVWARVGAAMKAVHQGANLTVAAHEAGFSSSAHFSSAYRAMFGMTPSAFVAVAQSHTTGDVFGAAPVGAAGSGGAAPPAADCSGAGRR
jgi:AraC-like DNA-binding protein